MKRQTARVLRGVLRLIEDDLREIADSVVEIDEREARHHEIVCHETVAMRATSIKHDRRLSEIEAILAEHADNHSRRVQS